MSDSVQLANPRLLAAKRKLREQTRTWSGIEGCGTDGSNLRIYVSDETVKPRIPQQVDGFSVLIVPSGQIQAQARAAVRQ